MKERHLLIFWPSASEKYSVVVDNFRKDASIIAELYIECNKEYEMKALLNSLYGEKLAGKSYKYKEVGLGTISIFILEVNKDYQRKKVTSGFNEVNLEMFELKTKLRLQCGGGHNVHGTEDTIEASDDSLMFFNQEIEHIEVGFNRAYSFKEWADDWDGWIAQFSAFKKFNQKAAVLRGLSDQEISYSSDIDLITYADIATSIRKRLRLSAKNPSDKYSRDYFSLSCNLDFDMRFYEDNYLPKELAIELFNEPFCADKYSQSHLKAIAYHCLIHKNFVHKKYSDILGFNDGTTEIEKEELLGLFNNDNGNYTVSACSDLSVGYHNYRMFKGKKPNLTRRIYWCYISFRKTLVRFFFKNKYETQIEII